MCRKRVVRRLYATKSYRVNRPLGTSNHFPWFLFFAELRLVLSIFLLSRLFHCLFLLHINNALCLLMTLISLFPKYNFFLVGQQPVHTSALRCTWVCSFVVLVFVVVVVVVVVVFLAGCFFTILFRFRARSALCQL